MGKTCLANANQLLADVTANSLSAAALDDLLLFACVIGNSPALVDQIAALLNAKIGPAAAATWTKEIAPNLGAASIIFVDAINFFTLMRPLFVAQLFAPFSGYVLLDVPVAGPSPTLACSSQ